jgi:CRISPR/Cas system-associated endoribonuclease Cas2
LTRVQGSLFEGWETSAAAERIAARAAILAGEGASVRLYVIPRGGVARCQAWGFPPAPAPDGALIV